MQNAGLPRTTKEIKSFLGATGYYRKFIKDYSTIAYPLVKYLKQDTKIDLNDISYINAFNKLKTLLMNPPILKYPDFTKKFTLTTDASQVAIGAVLSQDNHPICYASRTLCESEQHYAPVEQEFLAVVWACKYFRPYLYGRKFTLQTDYRALKWIYNMKDTNMKFQRWILTLNEFDCDIEHIKGKENKVADYFSRPAGVYKKKTPRPTNNEYINEMMDIDEEDAKSTAATIHSAIEDINNYPLITEKPINFFKKQIVITNDDKKIKRKSMKI